MPKADGSYVEFEWDENKCESNLVTHGIDFVDAITVWGGDWVCLLAHSETGEKRFKAVGKLDNKIITVIYTEREEGRVCRIISARRARDNEKHRYKTDNEAQKSE